MSTALQLRETDAMAEWGIIREKAAILVKSSFLPSAIKTPEQALAIILTGRELGIGDMQALNNINVISGKPTIPPQLMLALINRTKELEDIAITDDGQACTVMMKRKGRQPHSETFSMKDAALMKTTEYIGGEKKTIALSEKYNWKQQPGVMRKWRAVAACARVVFPDVILGLYTPDEMGAHTDLETGEVIEAEPVRQVPPPEPPVVDVVDADYEPAAEPEPLPVSKPRGGYHDTLPERQASQPVDGLSRRILALVAFLKWDARALANEIYTRFDGLGVNDTDTTLALEALSGPQKKALLQALEAEKQARTGGR